MTLTALLSLYASVSAEVGVPRDLLQAVCFVESSHRPYVTRKERQGTSYGACQIKYTTAHMMGYRGSRYHFKTTPELNVYYAAKYLKWQLGRYGDTYRAVAAYNSGTYRERYGRAANHNYVRKVFNERQRNTASGGRARGEN